MQDAEFEREAAGFSSRAIPLRPTPTAPKSPLGRKPIQVPRCRSVVYCRGSVRRPVRPFVIEFKPRSSKSSAPRSPRSDEAGKINATPAFLDVGVFTANRRAQGDDYETAMKAADAVFGRSGAVAAEPIAPSSAPTGRVLPSLIENVDALAVPSTEIEEKPRRGRVAKKAEAAPLVRVKPRMRPKTPIVRAGKRRATRFRETRGDRLAAKYANRRRTRSRAEIAPKASSSRRGTKSRREVEATFVQGRAVKIADGRSPPR